MERSYGREEVYREKWREREKEGHAFCKEGERRDQMAWRGHLGCGGNKESKCLIIMFLLRFIVN